MSATDLAYARIRSLTPPRQDGGASRTAILAAIRDQCSDGWPTTIRSVCDAVGMSQSNVQRHVETLERQGLVERRGNGKSGIRPRVTA